MLEHDRATPENRKPEPSVIDAQDILILFGACSIVTGVWFVYIPAALIVAGLLCFAAVYLSNR
jgi:hypothetical protein